MGNDQTEGWLFWVSDWVSKRVTLHRMYKINSVFASSFLWQALWCDLMGDYIVPSETHSSLVMARGVIHGGDNAKSWPLDHQGHWATCTRCKEDHLLANAGRLPMLPLSWSAVICFIGKGPSHGKTGHARVRWVCSSGQGDGLKSHWGLTAQTAMLPTKEVSTLVCSPLHSCARWLYVRLMV